MSITQEELERRRSRIAELQRQIVEEESSRTELTRVLENEMEAVRLDTEIAELEGRLKVAQLASSDESIVKAVEGPMEQAMARLQAARATATAVPAQYVDTNAEQTSDEDVPRGADSPTGSAVPAATDMTETPALDPDNLAVISSGQVVEVADNDTQES